MAALLLHSMIEEGRFEAAVLLLDDSMKRADVVDASGSAVLMAEVGALLKPHAPGLIASAVKRYSELPDVLHNAKMRNRFALLG